MTNTQTKITSLITKIQNLLEREELYADIDCYQLSDDQLAITASISWGDWKHDHLRLDYLLQEYFNLTCTGETVSESDDSDCYSSIHYYNIDMDQI